MADTITLGVGLSTSRAEQQLAGMHRKAQGLFNNIKVGDGAGRALGKISSSAAEFEKSMGAANARVIAFGASVGLIYNVQKAFSELVKSTVKVERSLIEINTILGTSQSGLKAFGEGLFSVARETGQSFDTVAKAANELARQGLGMQETLKRTKDALILTRLSGIDAAASVDALTASMNSFSKSALDSTRIVNQLAAVDAAFAVSAGDLAEAMKRVGSTAEDSGVKIEELMAIVTSAKQITARDGAVIGQAFKTIFTRLQRPEVLNQLRDLGIAIKDASGEVLPALEIFGLLAKRMDTLTHAQKSQISESVAALYQINILKAAMGDLSSEYSIYGRALNIANHATSEATKRSEELNQSLSAMVNRTMVNLVQTGAKMGDVGFTPFAKSLLSTVNKSLEGANEADGEGFGKKIGEGVLKGIANIITGPGAILIAVALAKLTFNLSMFAKDATKNLLGMNAASGRRAELEANIISVLRQEEVLYKGLMAGAMSVEMVEKRILDLLKQQQAERRMAGNFAHSSAQSLMLAAKNPLPKAPKIRAAGHIPENMEKIAAYAAGYKPGQVKSMNISKLGKVFYNSAEKVKDFGMGQPAIMPPAESKAGKNYRKQFIASHGFDPYKAEGHIPGFGEQVGDLRSEYAKRRALNTPQDDPDVVRSFTIKDEVKKLKDRIKKGTIFFDQLGSSINDLRKQFSLSNKEVENVSKSLRAAFRASASKAPKSNLMPVTGELFDIPGGTQTGFQKTAPQGEFLNIINQSSIYSKEAKNPFNALAGSNTPFPPHVAIRGPIPPPQKREGNFYQDFPATAYQYMGNYNPYIQTMGANTPMLRPPPLMSVDNRTTEQITKDLKRISQNLAQQAVTTKNNPNLTAPVSTFGAMNVPGGAISQSTIAKINADARKMVDSERITRLEQQKQYQDRWLADQKANQETQRQANKDKIQLQQMQKYGNAAMFASMFPLVTSTMSNFIGDKTRTQRGIGASVEAVGSGASFAGTGFFLGSAMGSGPVGALIGGGLGLLLGLPKAIEAFTDTLPDLMKELDRVTDITNRSAENLSNYATISEKLAGIYSGDTSADSRTINLLREQRNVSFSKLRPEQQKRMLELQTTKGLSGVIQGAQEMGIHDEKIKAGIKIGTDIARLGKVKPQKSITLTKEEKIREPFTTSFVKYVPNPEFQEKTQIIEQDILNQTGKGNKNILDFIPENAINVLNKQRVNPDAFIKYFENLSKENGIDGMDPIFEQIKELSDPQKEAFVQEFLKDKLTKSAFDMRKRAAAGLDDIFIRGRKQKQAFQSNIFENMMGLSQSHQFIQRANRDQEITEGGLIDRTRSAAEGFAANQEFTTGQITIQELRNRAAMADIANRETAGRNAVVRNLRESLSGSFLNNSANFLKEQFWSMKASNKDPEMINREAMDFLAPIMEEYNSVQSSLFSGDMSGGKEKLFKLRDKLNSSRQELTTMVQGQEGDDSVRQKLTFLEQVLSELTIAAVDAEGGLEQIALQSRDLRAAQNDYNAQIRDSIAIQQKISYGGGIANVLNRSGRMEEDFAARTNLRSSQMLGDTTGAGLAAFQLAQRKFLFTNTVEPELKETILKGLESEYTRIGHSAEQAKDFADKQFRNAFPQERKDLGEQMDKMLPGLESLGSIIQNGAMNVYVAGWSTNAPLGIERSLNFLSTAASAGTKRDDSKDISTDINVPPAISSLTEPYGIASSFGFPRNLSLTPSSSALPVTNPQKFQLMGENAIPTLNRDMQVFARKSTLPDNFRSMNLGSTVGLTKTNKVVDDWLAGFLDTELKIDNRPARDIRALKEVTSPLDTSLMPSSDAFHNETTPVRNLIPFVPPLLKKRDFQITRQEKDIDYRGVRKDAGEVKPTGATAFQVGGMTATEAFRNTRANKISQFGPLGQTDYADIFNQRQFNRRDFDSNINNIDFTPNYEGAMNSTLASGLIKTDTQFLQTTQRLRDEFEKIEKSNKDLVAQNRDLQYLQSQVVKDLTKELYLEGRITGEEYRQTVEIEKQAKIRAQGNLTARDLGETFGAQFKYNIQDFLMDANRSMAEIGQTIKSASKDAAMELIWGAKSTKEVLRDLGLNIAGKITERFIGMGIDTLASGAVGGLSALGKGIASYNTKAEGGYIRKYSTGGVVQGGSGLRDDVPAKLTAGEYVIKKSAVQKIGIDNLNAINYGKKYAAGGSVLTFNNRFVYDDEKHPTSGYADIDPRLSEYALEDENNPQNAIRIAREEALFQYQLDKKAYEKEKAAAMKAFKRGQRNTMIAAYSSAAIQVGGAYIGGRMSAPKGTGASAAAAGTGTSNGLNSFPAQNQNYVTQKPGHSRYEFTHRQQTPQYSPYKLKSAGGPIYGQDDVPALLMGGEYVIKRDVVNQRGRAYFDKLNRGEIPKFAEGGIVGKNTLNTPTLNNTGNLNQSADSLLTMIDILSSIRDSLTDKKETGEVEGGNGAAVTNIFNIETTIESNGQAQTAVSQTAQTNQQSGTASAEQLKQFSELVKVMFYQLVTQEQRPGGLLMGTRNK